MLCLPRRGRAGTRLPLVAIVSGALPEDDGARVECALPGATYTIVRTREALTMFSLAMLG